jgi:uncharacterized protein (DUF362 family)
VHHSFREDVNLVMNQKIYISRREFLKMMAMTGGMAVIAPYLAACAKISLSATVQPTLEPNRSHTSEPTVTGEPTFTSEAAMETEMEVSLESEATPTVTEAGKDGTAKVAFVKTRNRADGVRRAIELLGDNPVGGKNVFLKPNFNSADPAPGSTHPDTLRALVLKLQEMGAQAITLGDRSGMGDTRSVVMQAVGAFKLAEELGFETIVFDELDPEDWVMISPPDNHWEQGFPFARPCLEAEALVQTCCLKTHQYGGHFTMSLKNTVGMVGKIIPGNAHNFMTELHGSPYQRAMIAETNLAYTTALIVLDGVEAFISDGPAQGKRVDSEVVLAGTDRIAIDAVGVALLRHFGTRTKVAEGPIFEQDQIARAVALGLGIDSPEKIVLVTGDPESAAYAEQIKVILGD